MWLTAGEVQELPDGAEVLVLSQGGVSSFANLRWYGAIPYAAPRGSLRGRRPINLPQDKIAHVGPRRIPPVGLLEWMKIGSLGVTSLTLALAAMETQHARWQGVANLGITPLEL